MQLLGTICTGATPGTKKGKGKAPCCGQQWTCSPRGLLCKSGPERVTQTSSVLVTPSPTLFCHHWLPQQSLTILKSQSS